MKKGNKTAEPFVGFQCPTRLRRVLRAQARREDRSVSSIIRQMLDQAFQQRARA